MCPRLERLEAWRRLARDLDISKLATISNEVGLTDVLPLASQMLNGEVRGRVVVDVNR
jgi:acrylyl-CoA reductase (NADPH)